MSLRPPTAIYHEWVQDGFVQGGHYALCEAGKAPFITPTKEMKAIALRHSDVVVDIGACTGLYALHCARHPVKKVRAYEPTPRTMQILRLSPLPNLETYQAAVTGQAMPEGTVRLFISEGIGITNTITRYRGKLGFLSVPAIPYEEALKDATVVKIDVEGAEYDYPIVQPSLRAIIIDFHNIHGVNWQAKAEAKIAEIEAAGFKSLVRPEFHKSNGLTWAGAWLREMPEDDSGYAPMLSGVLCCGCGKVIHLASKGLCLKCYQTWLPRHRAGYLCEGLSYG